METSMSQSQHSQELTSATRNEFQHLSKTELQRSACERSACSARSIAFCLGLLAAVIHAKKLGQRLSTVQELMLSALTSACRDQTRATFRWGWFGAGNGNLPFHHPNLCLHG